MDLEKETRRLFSATAKADVDILRSIAKAEEYLKESYEGRYFFELIQNVRDANKALNQQGTTIIRLQEDKLIISNTGTPFSIEGVGSICRIGKSDKASQDFIGHKGIGFKSVQEITERPIIITEYGTLYFDRQKTLEENYSNDSIDIDEIPLFFFPHYDCRRLEKDKTDGGANIVTQIELPLRDGVTQDKVFRDFEEITAKQLVLLGNINTILFFSPSKNIEYQIHSRRTTQMVEVIKNGEPVFFKEFSPKKKTIIPENVYEKLEKREKELFKTDRTIEIKILLEWDRKKRFIQSEGAKLYLFYPLEITSGFRFLIHSYFSVNPERKVLRKTKLNEFLLSQIAEYITGQFIEEIKKSNKAILLQILCFKRIADSGLDDLYDNIITRLRDKKFIYDGITRRFYSPSEVMIADSFDMELFPDGLFAGRRLIFIEAGELQDWLRSELKIPYLTYDFIRENIEQECTRQRNKRNIAFFQSLYNYASTHEELDLQGKRILLTEHNRLVSSDIDVFYGGTRKDVSLPKSLRNRVTFIHKDITISDFREGRNRIGVTEFSTYALVIRLLKLFDDSEVDNIDLIRMLKNLDLDRRSLSEIKTRILVPIKGKTEWLNPLYTPVYFDIEEIKELYPEANYVDLEKLMEDGADNTEWMLFLNSVYVWDRPALFLKSYRLDRNDSRNDALVQYTGKVSKPFAVRNDRCIDIPVKFSKFFFNSIIEKWSDYVSYVEDPELPAFQCRSDYSNKQDPISDSSILTLSHFVHFLKTNSWIWINGEDNLYGTGRVVAINLYDFQRGHFQVLKKYLKIVPIEYSAKQRLIDVLEIAHLSKPSISNHIFILKLLQNMYPEPSQNKDFTDCFNRILGFLFEFYNFSRVAEENITDKLVDVNFLATNDITKIACWERAENVLHIDDKVLYERLPEEIKARLQPIFTNRDKNAFGRIASRIGRVLTKMIQKNVVSSGSITVLPLVKVTPILPTLMALLENEIHRPLNDSEIGKTREAQIAEWEDLKTRVTIINDNDFEQLIDEDYSIELKEDRYTLNMRGNVSWENMRVKAQALTDLFETIFEVDLRGFARSIDTLLRGPTDDNSRQLLSDYDVSSDRISELRDLLEERTYSPVQQFWMAILSSKNIVFNEGLLIENSLNFSSLADYLEMRKEDLEHIHLNIDYYDFSHLNNLEYLETLFNRLGINLRNFNQISYNTISFKNYHREELRKLKYIFEKRFETWLYNFLSRRNSQEQSQFQGIMDDYKYFEPEPDGNMIKVDYEKVFDDLIREKFNTLPVFLEALRKETRQLDTSRFFYSNRRKFFSALRKAQISTDYVDEYLQSNPVRSRLYFGFDESFIEEYRNKFSKRIEEKTEDKNNYQKSMQDYNDAGNKPIEDYESKSGSPPGSSGGTKGKRQWRGDGGQSNETKKELIGMVAEWNVYQRLLKDHPSSRWVSRYAYKANINPEGEDGLGYDIEYIDESGNKVIIEVKGRATDEKSFEISRNEIRNALEAKEHFKIIFVANTLDNKLRSYRNLGNIFLFDEGEDFMNNKRFRAINEEYRITFQ